MADRAEISYSLQETVDGRTVTYDAYGNITDKNYKPDKEGPVEKLLFRRAGEPDTRVRLVTPGGIDRVHIQVIAPGGEVWNYFISTVFQTWERRGPASPPTGDIRELEIRVDEPGEPWQQVQWALANSPGVVLNAIGSSCTYRFNRLTQRWERIC